MILPAKKKIGSVSWDLYYLPVPNQFSAVMKSTAPEVRQNQVWILEPLPASSVSFGKLHNLPEFQSPHVYDSDIHHIYLWVV